MVLQLYYQLILQYEADVPNKSLGVGTGATEVESRRLCAGVTLSKSPVVDGTVAAAVGSPNPSKAPVVGVSPNADLVVVPKAAGAFLKEPAVKGG